MDSQFSARSGGGSILFSMPVVVLIAAVMSLLSSCQNGQPAGSQYENYIDQAVDTWHFQGSYLVAIGDSVVARGSRGYADPAHQRLNTPETKFLVGSMTKTFTAIATLQLVEQGLLELNGSIDNYISAYPGDRSQKITIHDLLSHRSGIPDVISNPDFAMNVRNSITPEEIVSYFRDQPLSFEPGTQYAYSSSNYVLLGLIIEAVSGLPWERYVHEQICQPLGLKSTGVFNEFWKRSDFATGFAPDRSGELTAVPPIHPSMGYAAGALASTVDDLHRLSSALYGTTLLSRSTIEMMLTPHSPKYGYGWLVDDFGGHRLTAHGGGVPGYVSILQRWPDDSVCVVVLSNNVAIQPHTIANGLAAIALGEPYERPRIKAPLASTQFDPNDYVGDYQLGSGDRRSVREHEGRLTLQASSGPARPLLPEARDKFYFAHDQMTTVDFLRDSTNQIAAYIIRQAFDQDTAQRSDH